MTIDTFRRRVPESGRAKLRKFAGARFCGSVQTELDGMLAGHLAGRFLVIRQNFRYDPAHSLPDFDDAGCTGGTLLGTNRASGV